jgi:hypothetical protein
VGDLGRCLHRPVTILGSVYFKKNPPAATSATTPTTNNPRWPTHCSRSFELLRSASSHNEVPIAVVWIVPCNVTTENGPIAVGDLLVTSSKRGRAMKGTDRSRMLGAVVGKPWSGSAAGKAPFRYFSRSNRSQFHFGVMQVGKPSPPDASRFISVRQPGVSVVQKR